MIRIDRRSRIVPILVFSGILVPFLAIGGTGGHKGHAPDGKADKSGVVAIDVFAEGDRVDLLLASKRPGGYRLDHRRSVDAGATFSAPVEIRVPGLALHSPHRGSDPQIVANSDGILVAWTSPGDTAWGSGFLRTARSRDGGKTWSGGNEVAKRKPMVGQAYGDLVVDADGRIHAVWLDSADGSQGLRYASTVDLGKTWSKSETIKSKSCECCWNRIYSLRKGTLQIIYRDKDPRDMAMATSNDLGRTWEKPVRVGAFDWQFKGCPHAGGALAYEPGEKADENGKLHALIWTGAENQTGLHYLRSEDFGRTWKDARPFPDAAIHLDLASSRRRLLAVWDAVEDGKSRVKGALSNDGGQSWESSATYSSALARATHPRVISMASGFLVLWTEKSDGNSAVLGMKLIR